MPTTQDEATRILAITQEYLPLEKMTELFTRLDEEVGKTTTNDSLKQSLMMMRALVTPKKPPSIWMWMAFYVLVFIHIILVLGIVISFFTLPFFAPWYVALPLCTFIWFFSTTKNIGCKLTELENHLRVKLGLKKIGGFVGHYFLRPAKKIIYKQ